MVEMIELSANSKRLSAILRRDVRFKVPQNIDMQDKIIGPLTMIQFMYAVVGGGLCYGIFMSGIPKTFSIMIIIPVVLFVAALIFLKINERPFLDFFLSIIEFSSLPRQRIWHHQNMPDLTVEIYQAKKAATGPVIQPKNITREEIADLARRLDNPTPTAGNSR